MFFFFFKRSKLGALFHNGNVCQHDYDPIQHIFKKANFYKHSTTQRKFLTAFIVKHAVQLKSLTHYLTINRKILYYGLTVVLVVGIKDYLN